MKKKKSLPFDAIMAAVIVLLIAVLAVDGFVIQKMPLRSAWYPIFVFLVVAAAGVAEIIRSVRAWKKENPEAARPVFENWKNFLFITAAIICYMVGMWLLGFIISTSIFTMVFAWRYKLKHLLVFDAAAIAATVALYYCFSKFLYIFLPTGLLLERFF